jgi:DNA-binding NarL/FixJ family response regulator
MEKITVLVAEHHRMLRECWKEVLEKDGKIEVAGLATDADQAIQQARELMPDVMLMDLHLPPSNWQLTLQSVAVVSPGTKVVCISNHNLAALAARVLDAGALGFITRNSERSALVSSVLEASHGKHYICNETTEAFGAGTPYNLRKIKKNGLLLTRRQKEVVELVKEGYSSREIANRIFVSEKTVEVHRFHILKKLRLKNTASLMNYVSLYGV